MEAYGTPTPINQMASLSVPDPRTLLIQPWDPSQIPGLEKAILKSDLGLTPSNDGRTIRLGFPPLTEERRRELVRVVNSMAEEAKGQVRNHRRAARKDLEDLEKEGGVGHDDIERAERALNDSTRVHEAAIDSAREMKEKDLLEV